MKIGKTCTSIFIGICLISVLCYGCNGCVKAVYHKAQLKSLEKEEDALDIEEWLAKTPYNEGEESKLDKIHKKWHFNIYKQRLIRFRIKWEESYFDYCERMKDEE
jgi:hypothetical protein